jgi:sugar phosphate isomerase/epimerase
MAIPGKFEIQKVRQLIRKYNLGIVGHMGDWRFPKDTGYVEIRKAIKAEMLKAIYVLSKLGAKKVTIHAFKIMESSFLVGEQMSNDLTRELLTYARKQKVDLMIENTSSTIVSKDNRLIFERTLEKNPGVKVHIDIGHLNIGKNMAYLDKYLKKYKGRIAHIHVSDNKGKYDEHLQIGLGNISWKKIVKTLKENNYDGTITMETFRSGAKGERESMRIWKKYWSEI